MIKEEILQSRAILIAQATNQRKAILFDAISIQKILPSLTIIHCNARHEPGDSNHTKKNEQKMKDEKKNGKRKAIYMHR